MASNANPLSPNDPNSFSNPEDVSAERIKLRWNIDVAKKTILGSVTYHIAVHKAGTKRIIMDVRKLKINGVYDVSEGWSLDYNLGDHLPTFGQPLSIKIPKPDAEQNVSILIDYECEEQCLAVQWLNTEQTMMKKQPFMFSECQAIYARSLFPCQDTPSTKFTFEAEVTATKEVMVLMSAIRVGDPELISGTSRRHKFEQKNPVPSYLVAITVGKLENKSVGPRTRIWAEHDLLEKAATDLSGTEDMLKVAESIFGEYLWGIYDILILPPSFPFGGMENPCLTSTAPTVVTGDKSLSVGICYEMAYSWFGNLVSSKTFEHFWLAEGLAIFAARRIVGKILGEPVRQFLSNGGWNELSECIKVMHSDNPLTSLVPKLNGINPEEFFTTVPIEKGYVFIYYLEEKVGGPANFEPFLRHYLEINRFKSVDTDTFKAQFISYFNSKKSKLIQDIDWTGWLYTTGMPLIKPTYDLTLTKMCKDLKNRWLAWNSSEEPVCPFKIGDIKNFNSLQLVEFLAELLDDVKGWDAQKVIAMEEAYQFNSVLNFEVKYRWVRLCLHCKWKQIVPVALDMVTHLGRLKYIRPLYRDLYDFEEFRQKVIDTYESNKVMYMPASYAAVAKDLHLTTVPVKEKDSDQRNT